MVAEFALKAALLGQLKLLIRKQELRRIAISAGFVSISVQKMLFS